MLLTQKQIKRFREKPESLIGTLWIWCVAEQPRVVADPNTPPFVGIFLAKIVSADRGKVFLIDNFSHTHLTLLDTEILLSPYCGFQYLGFKESKLKSLVKIGSIWRVWSGRLESSLVRIVEAPTTLNIYSEVRFIELNNPINRRISILALLNTGTPSTVLAWDLSQERREQLSEGVEYEDRAEKTVEEQPSENTAPTAWSRLQGDGE